MNIEHAIVAVENAGSSFRGWMQSTGQTSTQAVSFTSTQGSQMIYAISLLLLYPRPLLFTPQHPQLGRYEVFATPAPLPAAMVDAGEGGRIAWTVDAEGPLDAFGTAGLYDRSALATLLRRTCGLRRAGWIQETGRVEAAGRSFLRIRSFRSRVSTREH